MKILTRLLTRYWGYLAIVIAVAGWFFHGLAVAVLLALSLAAVGYFLFEAPMWCGAETRQGDWCRNNSHGLLIGCHYRQHKWQRFKEIFSPAGGKAIIATSKSVGGALALLGGVVAGVNVLIAAGVLVFH